MCVVDVLVVVGWWCVNVILVVVLEWCCVVSVVVGCGSAYVIW